MNFLTDKIRPIYFKYLAAAFGSALITSIYGVVDAAMVGQYQGPTGTAALAVVAPVWNIIYSLGLLTGIGGSVLLSTLRGQAPGNEKRSNEYFTAAVFGVIWTLAAELVPNGFVRIFMTPTESILNIAPAIIRSYSISFLLLPFNIFSTYYFQAMMKPATAFVVSVGCAAARRSPSPESRIYSKALRRGRRAYYMLIPALLSAPGHRCSAPEAGPRPAESAPGCGTGQRKPRPGCSPG